MSILTGETKTFVATTAQDGQGSGVSKGKFREGTQVSHFRRDASCSSEKNGEKNKVSLYQDRTRSTAQGVTRTPGHG